MSKLQRLWRFIYWPDDDFLMLLGGRPSSKMRDELMAETLSEKRLTDIRDKDWREFVIDEEVTSNWREAYEIAAKYFRTKNHYDLGQNIADLEQYIKEAKDEVTKAKLEHSAYLRVQKLSIKRMETSLKGLLREDR